MKKIFASSLILFAILSSPSHAETSGAYLGVDAISTHTRFNHYSNLVEQDHWTRHRPTRSNVNYGAGINAKYAFNSGGIFFAPGIFFEQNEFNGAKTEGTQGTRLQTRNRYGIKFDFGADIANVVAPYLTVGYAEMKYRTRVAEYNASSEIVTAVKDGRAATPFFGAGLKISLTENTDLNAEYNYQRYKAETLIPEESRFYVNKVYYKTRLDIVKVGLSYKF